MKHARLLAILLCGTLAAACSSTQTSTPASNSGSIQFGFYDIKGGGGGGGGATVAKTANTAAPSANTAVGSRYDARTGSQRPAPGDAGVQPENVPLSDAERSRAADRKIIKNADLAFESDDPEAALKRIGSVAESHGGFVVSSDQQSTDVRTAVRDTAAVTIRVPAERFAPALDELRASPGRLVSEKVSGQDVTEEFIDIDARLKAKKALEAQFMEIMKRAATVEDALEVQSQLADVRAEVEKIEGRRRFLENQSGLSTIKVSVRTPAAIAAGGSGFWSELADSVNRGIDGASGFVLGLITFVIAVLPFALFVGLPGWLLVRYLWRKEKRRRTAAEILRDEMRAADQ